MFLWILFANCGFVFSWLHMSHNIHSSIWNLMSENVKISTRSWFIRRAENMGIPWRETTRKYSEPVTTEQLEYLKRKIENRSIIYPEYYLQPFHGYDEGNLNWKAAIEGEAATYSVSADYWKNTTYKDCAKWLRYNTTWNINHYLKLQHIPKNNLTYILDIGCSIGISSEILSKSYTNADVIGLDLSPYFLSIALYRKEEQNNQVQYIHANAESIPILDNSLDMVSINFMLHEVPHQVRMNILREIYRVLKPKGVLAILDLDPEKLYGNFQYNPLRKLAFESTEPHIFSYYKHSMVYSLEDSGFENIGIYKNDPNNKLWICQKSEFKIQTILPQPRKVLFSYAYV